METNHPTSPAADATTSFERELEELVLAHFGCGAAVENAWEIDSPVPDAPNWRVTVEKLPPTERTYEPSLLEERTTEPHSRGGPSGTDS